MQRLLLALTSCLAVAACGGDGGTRCDTDTYGAYAAAGGPRCGVAGEGSVYCLAGDRCADEAAMRCEVVASGQGGAICDGGIYDAFGGGDGPRCGDTGEESTYCLAGDLCVDAAMTACQLVGSDGASRGCPGPQYHAFNSADGVRCGSRGEESAYCMAGDRCDDETAQLCRFVRSPDDGTSCPDEPYDAFNSAEGPACGSGGEESLYCMPGDECLSMTESQCI